MVLLIDFKKTFKNYTGVQNKYIILVAPIKALCSQRFDDWKEKFGPIGLTCKELTGDTVMDDLFEIQHANIIMTTPVSIIYISYLLENIYVN